MNKVLRNEDLFSLMLEQSEATYLSPDDLAKRRTRVQEAIDPEGLSRLKVLVDQFVAGERELTAMDFYLELEQASCLILFHTLPRRGERNKHANGLQQTYGDHIRLMMLGFDMFDQSNLDWLMERRWQKPVTIDRDELKESMDRYHALNLSPSEKVALWITSALHDYGKIFRRGYGLDAEDAAPLCEEIVAALAPDGMSELIHYGIRNHDLIEYTVTGDTPSSFILDPLKDLPEAVQSRALPMLALIQHIGAASLGEGRLSKAKFDIYNACFDGTIVADSSIETRLGRMLFGGLAVPEPSATSKAGEILGRLDDAERGALSEMLEDTVLLGWEAVREQILEQEADEDAANTRMMETLSLVHNVWKARSPQPEHIVFARPHELVATTAEGGDRSRPNNEDTIAALLNGATALILR